MNSTTHDFRCNVMAGALVTGLILSPVALAQNDRQSDNEHAAADGSSLDLNRYGNGSYVTVEGTVQSVSPNGCIL